MSDSTPRQALGLMADGQELDALQVNDALVQFDAMTDICLLGQFVNTPPASPADGDMYLLGGAPTGAWTGRSYKIAYCLDGGWRFYTPFNGLRAYVAATHAFLVYMGGTWSDANALLGANEASIASAATCDLGAAGALFVAITGTTTITSFGTGTNLMRFVRFAGALTLTHNAASLILLGGASRVTAAGDTAFYVSDGSGNWRERTYQRAAGAAADLMAAGPAGSALTGAGLGIGMTPANVLDITQNRNGKASGYLTNPNTGNSAWAEYRVVNSAHAAGMIIQGTGYTPSGMVRADGAYFWTNGAGGLTLITESAQPIYFGTSNAYAGQIDASGSLLLGTTSRQGSGTGYSHLQMLSGDLNAVRLLGLQNSGTTLATFAGFYNSSGGQAGSIIQTGSASVSYGTSSDARLKSVARVQGDYRAAIRALWVGDYVWKADGAPGFGVLAQQAYTVMPHHAGVMRPADEAEPWQASSEPFAFLALWGAKDLYALVEALAARVAALEARYDAG